VAILPEEKKPPDLTKKGKVINLRQNRRLDVCRPLKGAYSQTVKNTLPGVPSHQGLGGRWQFPRPLWERARVRGKAFSVNCILPELSNSWSPPAQPGVCPYLIRQDAFRIVPQEEKSVSCPTQPAAF